MEATKRVTKWLIKKEETSQKRKENKNKVNNIILKEK